jgi:outer membrane assembly lipoprotein YfiO
VSRNFLALALLTALLSGCGSSTPGIQKLPGDETDFAQAKKVYEDGDFLRTVELLTEYVDAHPGSNRLDEALLLLGLSHERTGSNLLAVDDFNRLVRDFPQSPFREEAEFERANSHYRESLGPALDPENTETALSFMKAYLLRYPQGAYREKAEATVDLCLEKLAMKAYLNAQTYLRLKQDKAALIYLDKAIETKPDFNQAGRALAEAARVHLRVGEDDKARDALEKLLTFATPERTQSIRGLAALRREAEVTLERLGTGGGGSAP